MLRICLLTLASLIILSSAAFAGSVGVVLIGSSDYKDAHFMSQMTDILVNDPNGKFTINSGNDEQSKYQEYWFNHGYLEEPAPTPQNLMEYTKDSEYDKVLFLLVSDPVTDIRKIGLLGLHEEQRVSVEIKAYLIGKEKLEGTYSATNEDNSKRSALRARQGAFKKSIRAIYKGLMNKF